MDAELCRISNSEIERAIKESYKREKDRDIIRDRILNRMPLVDVIRKHFPEAENMWIRAQRIGRDKVWKMERKLIRNIRRRNSDRDPRGSGRTGSTLGDRKC